MTNGQVPSWLNLTHPRVSIVTHAQIFTDPSTLPTFSSPAIESQLHNIQGLSDRFLYFNDDVMLANEVWPVDFYSSARGQNVYLSWPVPPCVDACPDNWLGDGFCDAACNIAACSFDAGDCATQNAAAANATTAGVDGGGGGEASMHANGNAWHAGGGTRGFDAWGSSGGDSGGFERHVCAHGCLDSWLGDTVCDGVCNVAACAFDAGDCGAAQMVAATAAASAATATKPFATLPLKVQSLSAMAALPPSLAPRTEPGSTGGNKGSSRPIFAHIELVAPQNTHAIAVNFTGALRRVTAAAQGVIGVGGGVHVRKAVVLQSSKLLISITRPFNPAAALTLPNVTAVDVDDAAYYTHAAVRRVVDESAIVASPVAAAAAAVDKSAGTGGGAGNGKETANAEAAATSHLRVRQRVMYVQRSLLLELTGDATSELASVANLLSPTTNATLTAASVSIVVNVTLAERIVLHTFAPGTALNSVADVEDGSDVDGDVGVGVSGFDTGVNNDGGSDVGDGEVSNVESSGIGRRLLLSHRNCDNKDNSKTSDGGAAATAQLTAQVNTFAAADDVRVRAALAAAMYTTVHEHVTRAIRHARRQREHALAAATAGNTFVVPLTPTVLCVDDHSAAGGGGDGGKGGCVDVGGITSIPIHAEVLSSSLAAQRVRMVAEPNTSSAPSAVSAVAAAAAAAVGEKVAAAAAAANADVRDIVAEVTARVVRQWRRQWLYHRQQQLHVSLRKSPPRATVAAFPWEMDDAMVAEVATVAARVAAALDAEDSSAAASATVPMSSVTASSTAILRRRMLADSALNDAVSDVRDGDAAGSEAGHNAAFDALRPDVNVEDESEDDDANDADGGDEFGDSIRYVNDLYSGELCLQ